MTLSQPGHDDTSNPFPSKYDNVWFLLSWFCNRASQTMSMLVCADFAYPFLQRASCMLGNISAPPAFASEFPSKYMASASQASTSVRVTTGIIRIRNVSFTGGKLDCSLAKNGHLDIVLSFGLERNDVNSTNSHEIDSLSSRKSNSSLSRSWFYCMFLWIMVLSLSFKISSLVSPRSFMSWMVSHR